MTGNVNSAGAGGANGGGILNTGALTVLRSTVSGNSAVTGGGIANLGALTVRSSTVSGNEATQVVGASAGGGIFNFEGTATVVNSTVGGNTALARGGGISNDATGTTPSSVAIANSTIASNQGDGANLHNSGNDNDTSVIRFRSTIIADARAGGDTCGGAGGGFSDINSQGYNLADGGNCNLDATADQPDTDPDLGPLASNGGPTRTMALPMTSPAVDKGIASGSTTDQRGLTRPVDYPDIPNAPGGDGSDIGAFEIQAPDPPQPPSNDFTFGKVRKNKRKGTAKLTVNVPGAGELELVKTKKVKGDEERAEAEGSVKLLVKSKGKKRKKLRKKGKAKVRATVSYTPDGGDPNTQSKRVKLVRRR